MTGSRLNQKARTREAILSAAVEIMREGCEPTVPEAAERARVSFATAYRYFTSAVELQNEASAELLDFVTSRDEYGPAIEAAGDDVHARLETLVRTLGWRMLTDQAPFRQQVKAGHERWFANQQIGADTVDVRPGRRTPFIRRPSNHSRATWRIRTWSASSQRSSSASGARPPPPSPTSPDSLQTRHSRSWLRPVAGSSTAHCATQA